MNELAERADALLRAAEDEQFSDAALDSWPERPRTRGECIGKPRPCPWIGCRYHLLLRVTHANTLVLNGNAAGDATERNLRGRTVALSREQAWFQRALETWEQLEETCALDVADRGPHTLSAVGRVLGTSRERMRQVEDEAKKRLKTGLVELGINQGTEE